MKNLLRSTLPGLRFLLRSEIHVYAFAVAANVLISFFPFLVAMLLICRNVLHWRAAGDVIIQTVSDYFPQGFGVDFAGYLTAATQRRFSWLSVFLLLFTSNGIFLPLEVALNHIWDVKENRTFWRNQLISLALIFGCGALVLVSVIATTFNASLVANHVPGAATAAWVRTGMMRLAGLPATLLVTFLVYWLLPNRRIDWRRLVPATVLVTVAMEAAKYLNILTWPWLREKLRADVPPFVQSISIVLWSFVATIILLAGAAWARGTKPEEPAVNMRDQPQ